MHLENGFELGAFSDNLREDVSNNYRFGMDPVRKGSQFGMAPEKPPRPLPWVPVALGSLWVQGTSEPSPKATANELTIYINIPPQGAEAFFPLLDDPRWGALSFCSYSGA